MSCSLSPWSGKVAVTPISRAALDACGKGEVTEGGGRELLRRPYLQSVDKTSAFVAWAARPRRAFYVDVKTTDGEHLGRVTARYDKRAGRVAGDDPDRSGSLLASTRPVPVTDPKASLSGEPVAVEDFQTVWAKLTGLEPGKLYCYQVLSATAPMTDWAPLQTAPAAGSGATVQAVVLGDTGSGTPAQTAIAQRIAEHPFELMVFLGDVAYERGTAEQLQTRFFEAYADYLSYAPAFPSLGNHDVGTRRGEAYLDVFVLPNNERYYSFDWGDAHFVSLDTTSIDAEQSAWLDGDLARNELPWVIVYGHHPPISSGYRGGFARYQRFIVPVLERHRVDVLLAGHDHHYERIGPLRGGTHLIIAGGGGATLRWTRWESSATKLEVVHHFLTMTITERELTIRAIDIEGKEFDRLSLRK